MEEGEGLNPKLAPNNGIQIKNIKKNQIGKGKRVVKQMDVDREMGIPFQEEIIMDILSRLPVQSLLRFKCVSKPWKKLISEPYFTRMHLSHGKNNQNSQRFLICQEKPKGGMVSCYHASLPSIELVEDVQKLDCPSDFKPWFFVIFCCFDGLSLITVGSYHDLICLLWNPFTRESVVLPRPEFPPKEDFICGLGYDSTTDDYKILKIDMDRNHNCGVPNEILSLKNGSWSKIDEHPSGISYVVNARSSLAFVHGAFHWLGYSRNYSMISFSISNEVYGEIPLPERMCLVQRHNEFDVSVLEGMLCVYSADTDTERQYTFKSWLMKDYGVKESWTELITIQDNGISLATPKYRFTNGEVLLRCVDAKGRIVFMTSKGPFGSWPRFDIAEDGFVITESLISPKLLM
ncbi:F-box protein CPR1-like [Lycium ferocissimum]|uniref:F-box protein CPR1-like n=1 Tax=Lycium ferocissimum TaxID=112874 RepID=UPI002815847B|nr:F-box protein CPR1-like [Lycium ferocissimum]